MAHQEHLDNSASACYANIAIQQDDKFYVVEYESGFGDDPLPLWTDSGEVDLFDVTFSQSISRVEIPEVPGAFQLLNVLSGDEADRIVQIAEQLGFQEDSPVSLPHRVRHNLALTWVVSETIVGEIWNRTKEHISEVIDEKKAKGLNARFRFYKYGQGDFFKTHFDGDWTGSRVLDGKHVSDAFPGQRSLFSFLIFLNDGFEGGETQFIVKYNNAFSSSFVGKQVHEKRIDVRTTKGGVLCFPHGDHPFSYLHSSNPIISGTKYIIRSEIFF